MMLFLIEYSAIFIDFALGRFEDPEFTIKEAKIITHYPGATPKEVEQEVTETIEKAVQQMGQVKRTTSISRDGVSDITVEIKDRYNKHSLPQIWDELRRKVNDVQRELPPGAGPSLVNDDFGDVYGMYLAMTGDGFSYNELKNYADLLKKEVSLVPGIAKVELSGEQQEVIYVDISRARLARLGISMKQIANTISSQNLVSSSGEVSVGNEYLVIKPSGDLNSVAAVGNLLVRSNKTRKLIFLSDIAHITRGYQEVPSYLVYYNGKPAIGIGISIVSGGNVVKIGSAIEARLHELDEQFPIGLELHKIYYQPTLVQDSINGFVLSLAEALVIVIAILLVFMGLRSGLIIASVLLLTVLGTLLFMLIFGINLERISLGALIIALGMLVDNAIVVAEGILMKVNQGMDKSKAAKEVVNQTIWPLFGATVIGILAFAAIGLSQDATGEYTISLFYVIMISLMLSWFLAITITPLFCYRFLKQGKQSDTQEDPYKGIFFQSYKSLLTGCLKARWVTTLFMIGLLAVSIYGFKYVKQSFFPNSTTAMFYVDYWRSQGTDIRVIADDMNAIAKHMRTVEGITDVTTTIGGGSQRFMLVYSPEDANQSYGQFLVGVTDYRHVDNLIKQFSAYFDEHYPHAFIRFEKIRLGPGGGDKIEVRLSGPDANVLRKLSRQVEDIMRANPQAIEIRDDWRQKVKVIEPIYAESQARLTGINRSALSDALQMAFSGLKVGLYRENDLLIPIISRSPDDERLNIGTIDDIQVWSPLLQGYVPIGQVVSQFKTVWRNDIIRRRDRKMTITPSCNPKDITAIELFNQLAPKIQTIKLPPGYEMEWGR